MKGTASLMFSSIIVLLCAASPALVAAGATQQQPAPDPGQSKRPFEIADFYRCAAIGSPSVSNDGKLVAVSVRSYDLDAGKSRSVIWMMNADGSGLRPMTSGDHADTEPRFSPDGKRLLFTSNRGGSTQLWVMPTDGGEPRQLTTFGPGISGAEWSPDGRHLAATADIFLDCGIDEACNREVADGREKGKLKVHVADDLLYRHWTGWRDGTRTHVLLIDAQSGKVEKDLTPGPWDSPTFSLGGRGYAFSPDGKELCFVSNREKDEASSTNTDLWVVPTDGPIRGNDGREPDGVQPRLGRGASLLARRTSGSHT